MCMSKIAHVLAVDGGGSKTAAALLTAGGAELARCRVGPANLYRDPAAGLAEITAGWGLLCRQAGLPPEPTAATTVISAGLAGASGRNSARHSQRHSRALPLDASPATATPPFSACSATTRAPCSRSAPASSPIAAEPAVRRRFAAAGASRWPIVAAAPGSACAWPREYLDHLDGAAAVPASSLWAAAAATFGARARRRSWAGSPPPAPPTSHRSRRPSWPLRPPTIRWAWHCSTRVPATCGGWPMPWRPRQTRRSASVAGWPTSTARGSKPPCLGSSCRQPRGPTHCAAPGSSPPAPCRPNIPTSPEAWRKPALTSLMLEETRTAPARVAAMLEQDGDAYAALAAELRLRDPAFVVTVARGSSDHAALYLASLAGIVAGRITASLPPSLVTRYGAVLGFERAFVVSLSQSGASPDIVRTLEAAHAGGAVTAAIVNQAGLAPGADGGPFPAAARRARAKRGRDQKRDRDPGRLGPPGRDVGPGRGPAGRPGAPARPARGSARAATGPPLWPSSSRPRPSTSSAAAPASASPRRPRSSSRRPPACWPRR